ncbi:hypothetical protein PoB_005785300 [Plakobranchus ocellatus]|uniref:Uncharacterized protein n=1 Tax=Plakobranchus ocellatus TaxID=259542 RepID=A0AAV4CJX8_9GAST|nr:hypothetical protein PoB_005785300 [Plakobranchus ocellatus]
MCGRTQGIHLAAVRSLGCTQVLQPAAVRASGSNWVTMITPFNSVEACQVLTQLVPTLNDLALHIDNIIWASHHDFSAESLEALMVQIQSLIASTQTSLHNTSTLRHGISHLSNSHHSVDQVSSAGARLRSSSKGTT